jgi:hypothetical protein
LKALSLTFAVPVISIVAIETIVATRPEFEKIVLTLHTGSIQGIIGRFAGNASIDCSDALRNIADTPLG